MAQFIISEIPENWEWQHAQVSSDVKIMCITEAVMTATRSLVCSKTHIMLSLWASSTKGATFSGYFVVSPLSSACQTPPGGMLDCSINIPNVTLFSLWCDILSMAIAISPEKGTKCRSDTSQLKIITAFLASMRSLCCSQFIVRFWCLPSFKNNL